MNQEEPSFDVRFDIAEIKKDLRRILDHHIEFKQMFKKVEDKQHSEELERKHEDSLIRAECKEGVSQIYKNVAGYGIGLVVFLTTGIIGYLAYK
jgi:hypothetical protein